MIIETTIEILLGEFLKSLRSLKNKEDIYVATSVHVQYQNKEKFLLGDEHNNNNYAPIGGVIKSTEIKNMIDALYVTHKSSEKPRNQDDELAFVVKKPAKFIMKFRNKSKVVVGKILKNIKFQLLIKNAIRELKEEFGVKLAYEDFKENLIYLAIEEKKYKDSINRIHIYFIVDLNESGFNKVKNIKKVKMLENNNRDRKQKISDLTDIYKNSKKLNVINKK